MSSLYLIVRLAGQTVALRAEHVASVVQIDEIVAVPRAPAHVAGLFALRSRVLTVIDARVALGLAAPDACSSDAVIVDFEGHSYALVVDKIEDVIDALPPAPCPAVLTDSWMRASLGAIRTDAEMLVVLDPAILIAGCRQKAAA